MSILFRATQQNIRKDIKKYDSGTTAKEQSTPINTPSSLPQQYNAPLGEGLENRFASSRNFLGDDREGYMRSEAVDVDLPKGLQLKEQEVNTQLMDQSRQQAYSASDPAVNSFFIESGVVSESSERTKDAAWNSSMFNSINEFGAAPTEAGKIVRSLGYGVGTFLESWGDIKQMLAQTTQAVQDETIKFALNKVIGMPEATEHYENLMQITRTNGSQQDIENYLKEKMNIDDYNPAKIAQILYGHDWMIDKSLSMSASGAEGNFLQDAGKSLKSFSKWENDVYPHRDARLNDEGAFYMGEDGDGLFGLGIVPTKINYSLMFSPDFWTTEAVQQIPYLVEGLGVGSIFKKLGVAGLKTGLKAAGTRGAAYMAKPSVISAFKQKSLNKLYKTMGFNGRNASVASVTKGQMAEGLIETVFGGVGYWLPHATHISSQTYMDVLKLSGNPDVARAAAWGTFMDNTATMPLAIFQHSILTKGLTGIRQSIKLKPKGNPFKQRLKALMPSMALPFVEAKFEEIEEVYQDWTVQKNVAQYKGEEYMDFMDYYRSPEAAHTRVLSAGMGLAFGSIGLGRDVANDLRSADMRSVINDAAERSANIDALITQFGLNKHVSEGVDATHNKVEDAIQEMYYHAASQEDIGGSKDVLNHFVQLGGIGLTKAEADRHLSAIEAIHETFKPYIGITESMTDEISVNKKVKIAKNAYELESQKQQLNEINESYDAQIKKTRESDRPNSVKKRMVNNLIKQQQRANVTLTKDIKKYESEIETLLDEHDVYMKDKEAYLKTKRKNIKAEKANAPVVITKQVKESLKKQGYSNSDIKQMSVSQANKLVKDGTTKQEADKVAQVKETQSTALLKTKLLAADLGYKNADINKMSKKDITRVLNNKINKVDFDKEIKIATETTNKVTPLQKAELRKQGWTNSEIDNAGITASEAATVIKNKEDSADFAERKSKESKKPLGKTISTGLKTKKETDLAEEVYNWLQTDEGNLDNNSVQYEVVDKESGEVLFYRNPYIASASKLAGKSVTKVKGIVKEMQRQHMISNPGLAQALINNIEKAEKIREVKRKDKKDSKNRYSVKEEEESPTWERNIGAEKTLRRLLKGKNVNLITYNYAKKSKQGIRYYGAAQGLSIYLDAKKASHDVLFEELGHIYLDDASNLPSTKALRKIIHKEPVFKKKLNEYWFRIEYKNPDGIGKYLGDLVDIEADIAPYGIWKKTNKNKSNSEYVAYVDKVLTSKGYKRRQDRFQEEIAHEAMMEVLTKVKNQQAKNIQEMNRSLLILAGKEGLAFVRGMLKFIGNRFTKAESKKILEETGNEHLYSKESEKIIENVLDDFKNHKGEFTGEKGSYTVRHHITRSLGSQTSIFDDEATMSELAKYVDGLLEEETEFKNEITDPKYINNKEGQYYTPAGIVKMKRFIKDKEAEIRGFMETLRAEKLISYEQFQKYTASDKLINSLTQHITSSQSGLTIKEEDEMQAILSNQMSDINEGLGPQLSKDLVEFIKTSKDPDVFDGNVRRVLIENIFDNTKSADEFVENVETLIAIRKSNPESLSSDDLILSDLATYMQEKYIERGQNAYNPLKDLYNELKEGYMEVDYTVMNLRLNQKGKAEINRLVGPKERLLATSIEKDFISMLRIEDFAKPRVDKGETSVDLSKRMTAEKISKLSYMSNLGNLYNLILDDNTTDMQARNEIAKFIKDYFAPNLEISKSVIAKFEILNSEEKRKALVEGLINDTAHTYFHRGGSDKQGANPNPFVFIESISDEGKVRTRSSAEKENVKDEIRAGFNEWSRRGPSKEVFERHFEEKGETVNWDSMVKGLGAILTYSFNNPTTIQDGKRFYGRAKFNIGRYFKSGSKYTKSKFGAEAFMNPFWELETTAKKNKLFGYESVISVSKAVAQNLQDKKRESTVKAPDNKDLVTLSKKNSLSVGIDAINNFDINALGSYYKNNAIIELMKNNPNYKIDIKPSGGGFVTLEDGTNINYRKTKVSPELSSIIDMDLALQGIVSNNNYSMPVGIFGDKDVQYRWDNTPVYNLQDARKEIRKVDKRNTFSNGSKYGNFKVADIRALVSRMKGFISKDSKQPHLTEGLGAISNAIKEGQKDVIVYGKQFVLNDLLELMVLNKAISTFNVKELIDQKTSNYTSFLDNISRRMRSVSPFSAMGGDYRVEYVLVKSIPINYNKPIAPRKGRNEVALDSKPAGTSINIQEAEDAFSIISTTGAQIAKQRYGGIRDFGNHLKWVGSHNELENDTYNKNFDNVPFYFKTNTAIASQDFLKKNPVLKDVMNKIEQRQAVVGENTIVIFAPETTVKIKNDKLKKEFKSLEEIQNMSIEEFNKNQDRLFKFKDKDNVEKYGLSGKEIGIQLELDKKSNDSVLSKQLQLLLLSPLKEQAETVINNFVEAFKLKQPEQFKKMTDEALYDNANRENFAEAKLDLVKKGSFDNNSIAVRNQLVKSVFGKMLTKRGPGGTLTQMPGIFYRKSFSPGDVMFDASLGLQGYGRTKDGKITSADIAVGERAGLQVGDVVLLQRLPTSKGGDAIYATVVDVIQGMGNGVMVPAELVGKVGSDHDGDTNQTLRKYRNPKTKHEIAFNKAFDSLINFIRSPEYSAYMEAEMDYMSVYKGVESDLNKAYKNSDIYDNLNDLTYFGNEQLLRFKDEGQLGIGVAAIQNTLQKVLSAYSVSFESPGTSINGKNLSTKFSSSKSGILNMAFKLNILVDDVKKGLAKYLNMNSVTHNMWFHLLGRGASFKDTSLILAHPVVRQYVRMMQDTALLQGKEKIVAKKRIINQLLNDNITSDKIKSAFYTESFDVNTTPGQITKEQNVVGIIQLIRDLDNDIVNAKITALSSIINYDSNIPVTYLGGLNLLKQALDLGLNDGGVIDMSNLIDVNTEATFKELVSELKINDVTSASTAVQFKSSFIQNNLELLIKQINKLNADPAVQQGHFALVDAMHPMSTKHSFVHKDEDIEKTFNLVRSFRLRQTPGLYNFNIEKLFKGGFYKDSEQMLQLINPNTSVDRLMDLGLAHIKTLSMSQYKKYDFIKNYLDIQRKTSGKFAGYIEPTSNNKTEISIKDGKVIAENLEKKKRYDEMSLIVKDKIKDADINTVKKEWAKLDDDVKDFLFAYDLIKNNHTGYNTLLPYMFGRKYRDAVVKETKKQSNIKDGGLTSAYYNQALDFIKLNNRNSFFKLNKELLEQVTINSKNNSIEMSVTSEYIKDGQIVSVNADTKKAEDGLDNNSVQLLYRADRIRKGRLVNDVMYDNNFDKVKVLKNLKYTVAKVNTYQNGLESVISKADVILFDGPSSDISGLRIKKEARKQNKPFMYMSGTDAVQGFIRNNKAKKIFIGGGIEESARTEEELENTFAYSTYSLTPISNSFVRQSVIMPVVDVDMVDRNIESRTTEETETSIQTKIIYNVKEALKAKEKISVTQNSEQIFAKGKLKELGNVSYFQALQRGSVTGITVKTTTPIHGRLKKLKEGDVIEFKSVNNESLFVTVTKALHPLRGSGKNIDSWSGIDGYNKNYFISKIRGEIDNYNQIEFEPYIDENNMRFNIDAKAEQSQQDYLESKDDMFTEQEFFAQINEGSIQGIDMLSDDNREIFQNRYSNYRTDYLDAEEVYNALNKQKTITVDGQQVQQRVIDELNDSELLQIIEQDLAGKDPYARKKLLKLVYTALSAKTALVQVRKWLAGQRGKKVIDEYTKRTIAELENVESRLEAKSKAFKDIGFEDVAMHPDISRGSKTMETPEISFIMDRIHENKINWSMDNEKLLNPLKKAYNELVKEKFKDNLGILAPLFAGVDIGATNIPGIASILPRWVFQKMLYENFVDLKKEDVDEDGKYMRIFGFKKGINVATLSKAEANFYKEATRVTGIVENHLINKKDRYGNPVLENSRAGYIPATKANRLEMATIRNHTAAYIAYSYDSKLRGVHVNVEGKKEPIMLGDFINEVRIEQSQKGFKKLNLKRSREVRDLVKQAQGYIEKGVDAKGIQVILLEDASTGESAYADRYTESRSKRAEFEASGDVFGAITEYANKMTLEYGLDTQAGFRSEGVSSIGLLLDAAATYNDWKDNQNTKRWVKTNLIDGWYKQKGTRSIFTKDGKPTKLDKAGNILGAWTMLVGLGLKPTAAVFNVIIGKYNTIRRQGFGIPGLSEKGWLKGEMRFFGVKSFTNPIMDMETVRKTSAITKAVGLIGDAEVQVTEGFYSGGFGKFIYMFMTGSEKWIQRVGFISQLTDEEFNSFTVDKNGTAVVKPGKEDVFNQLLKNSDRYKDMVYRSQGRGYTREDQRGIQQYSLLKLFLTFKRWATTAIKDRVGLEQFHRDGHGEVGSITGTLMFMRDMFNNKEYDVKKIYKEYNALPEHRKNAIQRFFRGNGILFFMYLAYVALATDDGDETEVQKNLEKVIMDMSMLVQVDRLWYMASVPALQTAENISKGFYHLVKGTEYKRAGKYGLAGQKAYRSYFARSMPNLFRGIYTVEKPIDKN